MFFSSKKKVIKELVETVEAVKAEAKEKAETVADATSAPSAPIRIKVDGKVVYEGPSGSVKVEPTASTRTGSYYNTSSQVIINGVQIGGSSVSSPAIHVVIEGDVNGDVDAPMDVRCGNVKGDVDSGMSVTCGDVQGGVSAGMSVNCGKVAGRVSAGMNINMRS